MTTRNYDWSPLDLHSDPVPGDANYVAQQGRSLGRAAENMHSAASNLRRLESPQTCSEAVTKIMAEAVKAASSLEEAGNRYDTVASALSAYAPTLQWAQSESLAALQAAGPAHENEKAAYKKSLAAYWAAKATIDPAEREHAIQKYHRAKAQQDTASASLHSAKQRLHEAIAARDGAAQRAEAAVESATHGGSLNDSAWDKFADFMKPVAEVFKAVGKWVWNHIDEIALGLTIAAAIVAFIPGVNVIAGPLAALAWGAQALSKIKAGYTFIHGVGVGITTGKWGPAVMGFVGLGLSFVGGKGILTGGKKVLGFMARTGAGKAVGVGYTRLTKVVTKSLGPQGAVTKTLNLARRSPYVKQTLKQVDDLYQKGTTVADDLARRSDAIVAAGKRAGDGFVAQITKPVTAREAVEEGVGYVTDQAVKAVGPMVSDVAVDAAADWVELQRLQLHRLTPVMCGAR